LNIEGMGILLIDSSSRKIEFGFADDKRIVYKEELESGKNADSIAYFIKKALDENEIKFKSIEYVSLSNGPGSFTGLRIGSAIAKGICFSLGGELVEIPTLDIIANKQAGSAEHTESPGFVNGRIISVIFTNTKSGEFYYCEYEKEAGKLKRISDYKTDLIGNVLKANTRVFIDEDLRVDISHDSKDRFVNVSQISGIESQYELTLEYIRDKLFSDCRISEPFYMNEAIPKI
jgi:tRNA threonylcarbamoyl adenosine modification protein YeaZ